MTMPVRYGPGTGAFPRARWSLLVLLAISVPLLGLIITWSTRAVQTGTLVLGFVALVVVAILLTARREQALLWLMPWLIFQNLLVIELGFFLVPAYFLSAILFIRLISDGKLRLPWTPMNRPIKALLLIAVLSVPVSLYLADRFFSPEVGLRYTRSRPLIQLAVLGLALSIYAVTLVCIEKRLVYERTLRFFIVIATCAALYGLYQQLAFYTGLPIAEDFLPAAKSTTAVLQSSAGPLFRSNGTFLEPNKLGHFLVGSSALTLALSLGHANIIGWGRKTLWTAFALQFAGLLVTFSSGAYGGFVASLALFVFFGRARLRLLLVVAFAAALMLGSAMLLIPPGQQETPVDILSARVEQTIQIETSPASQSNPLVGNRRVDYWRASLDIVSRYPATGVGLGNFGAAASTLNSRLRHDAGSYGVLWAWMGEFGIWGVLLYLYFVGTYIRHVVRGYRVASRMSPELLGFLAGFGGMMTQFFASGYTRMEIHVWFFVGLAMAALRFAQRSHERI
jgi:O-antigen ligase